MQGIFNYAPLLNTVIIVFIAIFLVYKSHSWTGPILDIRVGKIEASLVILLGNFKRLEKDFELFQVEISKTDEAMLTEMKAIGTVGHEFNALRHQFTELESSFLKIDQMTTALPCNPCKGEVKK